MSEEKIIIGQNTDYPLNGILTIPSETEHPVPACVFVHGSGSSDMNEHIGKLYPFRDLAEGLMKYGIASIRYDKRSYAHGRKMLKSKQLITVREETIEDAILAADLLRNDPRIDSEKIFIIGHSMGAMLAPRIDHEGGNFKGLIMMAGSPFRLEEILKRQLAEIAEHSNALVRWIINKQASKLTKQFDDLYEKDIEETKKIRMGGGTTLYYFREMGDHPVSMYLKSNEKPILIMQGEKDFQAKADPDYREFQNMLSDKDNVTFRLFPGLNHLFTVALSDDISKSKNEYSKERHIPDEVIRTIAEWIFDSCKEKQEEHSV